MREKSVLSARFIQALDGLINRGELTSYREFTNRYGYYRSLISHIKSGRMDAPVILLEAVVKDYRVNPAFLFDLSDKMLRS